MEDHTINLIIVLYVYDYINYLLNPGDYTSILQATSGWIVPFDEDNNGLYDPNLRCTWAILHRKNTNLLLNIHEMDIEDHASCDFDFLKVNKLVNLRCTRGVLSQSM